MIKRSAEDKARLRKLAKEGAARMLEIDLDYVEKETGLPTPVVALQFMAFAAAENDANREFSVTTDSDESL